MSAPRSLLSAVVNGPLSLQVAVNKTYVQLSAPLHLFAPDSVMGRMCNIEAKLEEEKKIIIILLVRWSFGGEGRGKRKQLDDLP